MMELMGIEPGTTALTELGSNFKAIQLNRFYSEKV